MALIDVNGKRFKNFMAKLYGIGAAVVILGALFKIMHWEGANYMLVVGLGTEAVIFLFSAFEKPATEYDWSLVYPELATGDGNGERSLSVTEQLDTALQDGGIDSALIQRLGDGMRSLSETAGSLSGAVDAAGATAAYSEQLNSAATNMENLNALYAVQLENATAQVERQNDVMEKLNGASTNAEGLASQLQNLRGNLETLNSVYGGMLTAMGK
ncbi:MAG: gliding motility protein GldL [Schleiferiaceae bacterium]|jgi:gliding motility-associated protein GldL|nr:gliding motility protein GldL [Schleiferiaceae bacterium]MDP4758364.1 gliding motility protein GldL [Schleiferiaceae bacterium]MDP4767987.1 gliding motility protein GldL [Schleiferiaceae bacterium]MDP4878218.1 gliding motility protein GldL [Schleiferiaceae bacterium]MDP4959925.1 gliding motility protein GldL [Schleiferiaceae bacterium]